MRAGILILPFKQLTRSLEHKKNIETPQPINEEETQTAILVGQAINRAAEYTPWKSACLAQSLTAHRMLRKRNIPGAFYLGIIKDKTGEKKMRAHAWSQCGDRILTGGKDHNLFTVVSVFIWERRYKKKHFS
jgi:hypothetical protein